MTLHSPRIHIRYDEGTQTASVLDLIRTLTGCRSNHAAALLGMLREKQASSSWVIKRGRINGRGRLTPLASQDTLAQILNCCPPLRRAGSPAYSASVVLRLLETAFTTRIHRPTRALKAPASVIASTSMKQQRLRAVRSRGMFHRKKGFGPLSAMICVITAAPQKIVVVVPQAASAHGDGAGS